MRKRESNSLEMERNPGDDERMSNLAGCLPTCAHMQSPLSRSVIPDRAICLRMTNRFLAAVERWWLQERERRTLFLTTRSVM